MSAILITACVAVGTPFALLSLAYFAASSAYRQQALLDEDAAKLWTRAPARAHPIASAVIVRPAPRRRARVTASCTVIGKPTTPTRPHAAGSRRH